MTYDTTRQSIKQAEEHNHATLDKVRDEIYRQDEYMRSLDTNGNTITSHRLLPNANNNHSNNSSSSNNSNNNNSPSQSMKRSPSASSNRPIHTPTSHILSNTLSSPSHAQANPNTTRRKSVKSTSTSSAGKRSNDVSVTTDTTLSFDADGFMAGVSSYQPRGSVTRPSNGSSQLSASRPLQSSRQGPGQKPEHKERMVRVKLSPKRAKAALINVGVKAMSSVSTGNELKSTKTQQQLSSMVMEVEPSINPLS